MPNPLLVDPTRTAPIRRRFLVAMAKRFDRLEKAVRHLVEVEDAFGLKDRNQFKLNELDVQGTGLTTNKRWAFETNEGKVRGFRKWLNEQVDAEILSLEGSEAGTKPWMAPFISSAYKQGVVRAYTDAHSEDLGKPAEFHAGTQAQFLEDMFNSSISTEQLERLYTRTFNDLEGVTAQMGTQMSRVLTDGLAHGLGPRDIARRLTDRVSKIGKSRALTIARTEIIYSHAEGQLDSFERMGVNQLGLMVEWDTAHDGKVCKQCSSLQGVVLSVKEARGLIPRHPNCRCAWVPAFADLPMPGQQRTQRGVKRAFHKSVKAEKPKAKDPRKASRWLGAGKTIRPRGKGKRKKVKLGEFASVVPELWNYQPTAVIRWMGAQGWSIADAKKVLAAKGVNVSEATIKTQIYAGKKGIKGVPAQLSDYQIEDLKALKGGLG